MRYRVAFLMLLVGLFQAGCQGKLEVKEVKPNKISMGDPAMLEIQGGGFADGVKVLLGDQECAQLNRVSKRRLFCMSPKTLAPGTIELAVINPDGGRASLAQAITVESKIGILELSPNQVPVGEKGVQVRIKGTGFLEGVKVTFGDKPSPVVTRKSDQLLIADAPELELGFADVTAINPDGVKATLEAAFQVLAMEQNVVVHPFTESAAEAKVTGAKDARDNGVSIDDLNGDGNLDILVTQSTGINLYLGDGTGAFVETTAGCGIKIVNAIYGAFLGDFDNDGLTDIFLTGQPSRLYHNVGGGRFEDVTERVGFDRTVYGWAATWIDYDADGLLDIYVGSPKSDDHLYHNAGGKFEEVFSQLFLKTAKAQEVGNQSPTTFSVAAADYDNDGWTDLYVGVRGQPSFLFHNVAGKSLTDVLESMGVVLGHQANANVFVYKTDWGIAWADYNNDGYQDLVALSGNVGSELYQNHGGKKFLNATKASGIPFPENALAAAWGDLDNDGWIDLVVGDHLSNPRLFKNNADGSFRDLSMAAGIDLTTTRDPFGLAMADFNKDGVLDLYVVSFSGDNLLYMGPKYSGRHWLEVKLEGTVSNRMGIGARVTALAGATVFSRSVSGGESYLSQPPSLLHFGLGAVTKIDKLTVTWPGGQEQVIENVAADQLLVVKQPGERKPVTIPPPPIPTPGPAPTEGATASAPVVPPPPSAVSPSAPPTPATGATATKPAAPPPGQAKPAPAAEAKPVPAAPAPGKPPAPAPKGP